MRFGERDALGQLAISFGLLVSGLGVLWLASRGDRFGLRAEPAGSGPE
jgi:hypothetical protein